ncbi:SDR family NAD(P)-dependent oxidoreductase [Streptomyces sp. Je 1-369]|uniref:SDR family NAD(P)-dependent oxidoreductase n=1 Tax=Streptomyces sp. Je 1-369 TaxID=2966192 RepID=UPI0022868757|nr:SDR family NAD(P)-dependent oxidoreductase [Streptomyces sp. Je 1-369]WAL98851.1 SDR family NAD(P)-dependent oxidoreductase [Streptomyces sp. Je 1-369]
MEISGARVLVVGATGVLGGLIACALAERGAQPALAGRNPVRLAALARDLGGPPARCFEACDLDQCSALGPWAERALSGLDGVLVTVGAAAFGAVEDVSNAVAGHLLTVNALCPMAVLRGAAPVVADKGFLLAMTGGVPERARTDATVDVPVPVEHPGPPYAPAQTDHIAGTADYTASKEALSGWLGVLSEELAPRSVSVLDIRSPHLDTGFTERPLAGQAPTLPPGADALKAVHFLMDSIASA